MFVLLCFIIWLINLDSLLKIDNIYFAKMVHRIYPAQLQLIKHNASDTEAPFLDFYISICNGIVATDIFDKMIILILI